MDINPVDVGLAAVILPPLTALINQHLWPAQIKGLIALAVCMLYAVLAVVIRGDVTFSDWRDVALTATGTALAAYRLFWKPSAIGPDLEKATTIPPAVAGEVPYVDPDAPPSSRYLLDVPAVVQDDASKSGTPPAPPVPVAEQNTP